MQTSSTVPRFGILPEFRDSGLELAYMENYAAASRRLLSALALTLGLIFFGVGFFDLANPEMDTALNLLLRGGVLGVFVAGFLVIRKAPEADTVFFTFFLSCSCLLVCHQLLLICNNSTAFMDQAMAILLVIISAFLIPSRWLYSLIFSLGTATMFLATAPQYIHDIGPYQFYGVLVYFILGLGLSGFSSYSLNKYRRLQFFREIQLQYLSETDSLTGIYNRQKFDEIFAGYAQNEKNREQTFSLIMFDLDNFKRINDRYGHLVGDQVLIETVRTVRSIIREHDVFARWGGEEFMLLFPCAVPYKALEIAERMRQAIESRQFPEGFSMTASFGLTLYREDDTPDSVLSRVDKLLYKAKGSGKNRVCDDIVAGCAEKP